MLTKFTMVLLNEGGTNIIAKTTNIIRDIMPDTQFDWMMEKGSWQTKPDDLEAALFEELRKRV